MKKYVNGEYIEMTEDDIKEMPEIIEQLPTLEERLNALEMMELERMFSL